MLYDGVVPVLLVFHIQCAADSTVLLSVPAHQQYRQAGPHALHPGLLPAASGVASRHAARQRRPTGHRQCNVSVILCKYIEWVCKSHLVSQWH